MRKHDLLRVRYFIYCLFHRDGYAHAKYIKKFNGIRSIGENCFFQPFNLPADGKHISMGDNVVVASNVSFICHDVIHKMLNHSLNYSDEKYNTYWADIIIENNVFIGDHAIILPGVVIGSNTIIAAGAVVVHDVKSGVIVGGVPARVIGTVEELAKKRIGKEDD